MKNFVFVMFIFLNFNILTKCSLSSYDTNELNYFVYFLRDRNKIICTRREIENSSSISKSILPDYESSCLIELKQDGIYKLNLKLKEINFNSLSNLYENLNENDNDHSKKTLKIIIDENILVNNLEYDPHYIISQELFLKLDNGIVYYSNHDLCNDYKNKRNCRFIPIPNINPSQIKLDFDFASYDHNNNIVLIEKESKTNSNSCSPPCVNGICYNSSCFCKNGYMGANCSISTAPSSPRVSITILAILFVLSALGGVLLSFLIYWLFLCICLKDKKETSREGDIIEHWGENNA